MAWMNEIDSPVTIRWKVHNTRASAEWASPLHVPSSSWCQKGQQQAQTLAWLGITKTPQEIALSQPLYHY